MDKDIEIEIYEIYIDTSTILYIANPLDMTQPLESRSQEIKKSRVPNAFLQCPKREIKIHKSIIRCRF